MKRLLLSVDYLIRFVFVVCHKLIGFGLWLQKSVLFIERKTAILDAYFLIERIYKIRDYQWKYFSTKVRYLLIDIDIL